jgi:hypothetical protein
MEMAKLTSRAARLELPEAPDLLELEGRPWMLGDIERTGTLGGGPGSDPGERRWEKPRWAGPWDCIIVELG